MSTRRLPPERDFTTVYRHVDTEYALWETRQ